MNVPLSKIDLRSPAAPVVGAPFALPLVPPRRVVPAGLARRTMTVERGPAQKEATGRPRVSLHPNFTQSGQLTRVSIRPTGDNYGSVE